MNQKTVSYILKQKGKKKISMLTCYDYSMALILEKTDLDMILIGDSLGNVIAGHETTVPVTVEDIIYHTRAVKRAASKAFILADMPFMSYQASMEEGMRNAGRLMKEGLANGVKLEGGEEIVELVRKLTRAGIPVMGHIGLQPQAVHQVGGFKVIGKTEDEINTLIRQARALEEAGAFGVVLELVPAQTAKKVSESIRIPTIGIGAGAGCDGQVLVIHDMLGINPMNLKHNKKYLNLSDSIQKAVESYIQEVENGSFPGPENSF
jgi:3-methyl-2-oxobutanoate hydroxymethyltransferase